MDYEQRWQKKGELGQGGQGRVHKVWDKRRALNDDDGLSLTNSIRGMVTNPTPEFIQAFITMFRPVIYGAIDSRDPRNYGALKVLHQPQDASEFDLSLERMKREIDCMSQRIHPNLLRLIDSDPDGKWYVSQFYANGTLDKIKDQFTGKLEVALRRIRPVVEAVAELHKKGFVHRDIKPENIFVGYEKELILGDFGLVFFEENHSRMSKTFENVGSRDWMPTWAMGERTDISPAFDVFSLGKLLYSMISREQKLLLWYFRRDKYNLELLFPDDPNMKIANDLLSKCIVEDEEDCLKNAGELVKQIDKILLILERQGTPIDAEHNTLGNCKICGIGKYELQFGVGAPDTLYSFGVSTVGYDKLKVFVCSNCGNAQMFYVDEMKKPPAWK